MSCYVMKADSIRKIAYSLADILNHLHACPDCTIASDAATVAKLPHAFSRYFSHVRWYNGEAIAEDLHRLNMLAYCGRYREDPETGVYPIIGAPEDLSIVRRAEYGEHSETPQPWHYELAGLLDCWLYQTAEVTTANDPTRAALQSFSAALKSGIVQHSPAWNNAFMDA